MAPCLPLGMTHCQTLRWCSGSWVPPGARQCLALCGESMQAVPGGWMNWYHWMAPTLACHKSNRTPLGHYISVQVAAQTVQELSDALVQIWEEIPQDTIRRLIRSTPQRYQAAYKHVGAIQTTEYHFELLQWNSAKWTSLQHNIFTLIFGVSLNSALCRLIIFNSIKQCGILSFLTHYPVHISIDIQHDIFPHWDLMCFQSVPFIYFDQCNQQQQSLHLQHVSNINMSII